MIHLAGQPVQADCLVVQRCALCGFKLVHEYHPEVRDSKGTAEVYANGEVLYVETVDGENQITPLNAYQPLSMPYPNHMILQAMGGMLCTVVNEDVLHDEDELDDFDDFDDDDEEQW